MPARLAFLENAAVRALVIACCVFAAFLPGSAGGPRYVAGASYFDRAVKGTPLTWAGGQINYYTDQGNLSPLMNTAAADAVVALVTGATAHDGTVGQDYVARVHGVGRAWASVLGTYERVLADRA